MNNKEIREIFAQIISLKLRENLDKLNLDPILDFEESIPNLYQILQNPEFKDLKAIFYLLTYWWSIKDNYNNKPLPGWNLSMKKATELLSGSIDKLSSGGNIRNSDVTDFENHFASKSIIYKWFPSLKWQKPELEQQHLLVEYKKDQDNDPFKPCDNIDFLTSGQKRVLYCSSYTYATSISFLMLLLGNLPFNMEKNLCSMIILPNSSRLNKKESLKWDNLSFDWGKRNHIHIFPKSSVYNPLTDYIEIIDRFCDLGSATIYESNKEIDFHSILENTLNPDLSIVFNNSLIFAHQDVDGLLMLGIDRSLGDWPDRIKARIEE